MELCDNCHARPATIHISQMNEDEPVAHHYCEDCADELGVEAPQSNDEVSLEELEEEETLTCPTCLTTEVQFEEDHKVGCSTCYSVFADSISARKSRFKGFKLYRGKKYRVAESQTFFSELQHLKDELNDAVKLQKFELASVLRDRIRILESMDSAHE